MIIQITVVTNAAKEAVQEVQEKDGAMKVKVTAKPIGGEANKAVIAALAKHFAVSENKVKIIHGLKSRKKVVEILLA